MAPNISALLNHQTTWSQVSEPTLLELLDQAWRARFNQEIERALLLLIEVKTRVGIPVGIDYAPETIRSFLRTGETSFQSIRAEAIVLEASLARVQRLRVKSSAMLQDLRNETSGLNLSKRALFALMQELGLDAYASNQFSRALEFFISAKVHATNPLQLYASTTNSLLCFENLGILSTATLKEAEVYANQLANSPLSQKAEQELLAPIYAYNQRQQLLQGDVQGFLKDRALNNSAYFEYQCLWLESLPWHRFFTEFEQLKFENLAVSKSYLFQHGYRLRTILGLTDPDDRDVAGPTDIVERLYLWTWRWLIGPEKFPLHKILKTLNEFDIARSMGKLTALDKVLLRNALLWLGLFDAGSIASAEGSLDAEKGGGPDFPLYSFERSTILYLVAKREQQTSAAEDLLKSLKLHPLWQSGQLLFRCLLLGQEKLSSDAKADPTNQQDKFLPQKWRHLDELRLSLTALTCSNEGIVNGEIFSSAVTSAGPTLSVDLIRMQLHRSESSAASARSTIASDLMCSALLILKHEPVITCSDFCLRVFGVRRYNPLQHDSRMYSLLSRLRTYLPTQSITVAVKGGKIRTTGAWERILFIGESALSRDLRVHSMRSEVATACSETFTEEFARNTSFKIDDIKARLVASLNTNGERLFNRKFVESMFAISKSSAGRILDDLVKHSVVTRVSNGPKASYQLNIFLPKSSAMKDVVF